MSLLELIFALAATAVFFFVLLSLYPTAMASIRTCERRLQAAALAEQVLDRCSAGSFDILAVGDYSTAAPGTLAALVAGQTLEDGTVLSVDLQVQPGTDSANTAGNLRSLTVTVSWQEQQRSLQVTKFRELANLPR